MKESDYYISVGGHSSESGYTTLKSSGSGKMDYSWYNNNGQPLATKTVQRPVDVVKVLKSGNIFNPADCTISLPYSIMLINNERIVLGFSAIKNYIEIGSWIKDITHQFDSVVLGEPIKFARMGEYPIFIAINDTIYNVVEVIGGLIEEGGSLDPKSVLNSIKITKPQIL